MNDSLRVEHDLRPHNIDTINKILEIYKQSNRCCAIQATGTGKTYLILRLLEIFDDQGKVAVVFAPNREIIRQTKEKMKQFSLKNARFYTYQKLANMNINEMKSIKADLIICDELHRTGAKTWGQKFETFAQVHPDSKIFGATATPVRCLDGRDMAEEYFEDNKACDISLAEALVRKIIPVMPIYISALYTFEEEYQKLADKISNGSNTKDEKADLMKELKSARQHLEKSNGIPEIIKKHIKNYNGKYIVFCRDKKHLHKMQDIVIRWFRDAGYEGTIFDYPYYSNNQSVKRNLENFSQNNKMGLKLLFVIDKLNEGLHLKDIQGCILLRTTNSNIIYYQQIGRAIDAGTDEQRIILDLVSNFNNLKTCNFKKELENAITKENKKNQSKIENLDQFHLKDYVQDCINIFQKIECQIYGEKYNEKEDEIICKYYGQKDGIETILTLLPNRTRCAIILRAAKLGLKSAYFISEEEKKYIIENYKTKTTRELASDTGLSIGAVQQLLMRLSLKKTERKYKVVWDDEKKAILEKYYPVEGYKVIDRFNGEVTKGQIKSAVRKFKIKRELNRKYKYIYKDGEKFHVAICVDGKNVHFGNYNSLEEARRVAAEKAKEYGRTIDR